MRWIGRRPSPISPASSASIWRARKLKKPAYFDQARFGCLGGAFYLGFLKPQLEFITHYVSTGIPNVVEGECYLDSPAAVRRFFEVLDPRPAPAQFCVFKQLSQFTPEENPEVVIFFARAETICGLNQLATFVTNDFEVVQSPFGAGLLQYRRLAPEVPGAGPAQGGAGRLGPLGPQVLEARRNHLRGALRDVPAHGQRWRDSFLTKEAWKTVRKKIELSRKAWKE